MYCVRCLAVDFHMRVAEALVGPRSNIQWTTTVKLPFYSQSLRSTSSPYSSSHYLPVQSQFVVTGVGSQVCLALENEVPEAQLRAFVCSSCRYCISVYPLAYNIGKTLSPIAADFPLSLSPNATSLSDGLSSSTPCSISHSLLYPWGSHIRSGVDIPQQEIVSDSSLKISFCSCFLLLFGLTFILSYIGSTLWCI